MGRSHLLSVLVIFSAVVITWLQQLYVSSQSDRLPPQVVSIDVPKLTVLGERGIFRNITTPFNPSNQSTPYFQLWDNRFLDILGPNPTIRVIAESDDFPFAHEGPIWDPATDDVYFASSRGPLGTDDPHPNNQVSKISLKDAKGKGTQNITFTKVHIKPQIQMVNGATPYKNKILFVASGRGNSPPGLSLVEPRPPYSSTTILDNLHGRQFNSLNDAKVHPKNGMIYFTDAPYGFLNNFRPSLQLPNQVYRFDPDTSELRVVADGFDKCNGIAFSPDGSVAYVSDTGATVGGGMQDPTKMATIYVFDVVPATQVFTNRRVLAYVDTGIPDGIQVDSKGNIYASCGDGVQVFNPSGVLLGKLFLGSLSANNVFAGMGRLVILAETKIVLVDFAAGPSLTELQS